MSVHPLYKNPGDRRAYAWKVRWKEANGRQRSKVIKLKDDAVRFDLEVTRRKQIGELALTNLTSRGPTLAEWMTDRWLPEHGANLEQSTLDTYAWDYADKIAPWLGHQHLQDLDVAALRKWQADRLADGVSAHGVLKARTVLSSVLRHAAESSAMTGNPLPLVRAPRLPHKDEVLALTPGQIERIRQHLDPHGRLLVSLLAYAGLRPGELRTLRWGDVRQRTLLVQRAGDPAGRPKSVKGTRQARTVRLLPALVDDLAEHRDTASRSIVDRLGERAWTRDQWSTWRDDHWRPACLAAGFEPSSIPRPYDLRHSFASLLLAEGRTVHDVAKQLGHSAEMTLRVYGHVIDEYAGLEQTSRPSADEEIARARAKHPLPAPEETPSGRRLSREELDDHLRHRLATTAPHQTSGQHAQALQAEGVQVTSEAVTRSMKRLVKQNEAGQTITRNLSGQPVLAWHPTRQRSNPGRPLGVLPAPNSAAR